MIESEKMECDTQQKMNGMANKRRAQRSNFVDAGVGD